MNRREILMAGTGGQGLVFMASFLAEAAMRAGSNVVQTQTYGIAQRGGFISAEVVLDKEEILHQQVLAPDVIIALHDVVGARYDAAACPVLYDSSLMQGGRPAGWTGLPFTKLAEEAGAPKAANLAALGAMSVIVPLVSFEALDAAAEKKFKGAAAQANRAALAAGRKAAQALRETE